MDCVAMTMSIPERAAGAEASFRAKPGLYLIGSLERGVTVYNQQLRAHNLAWALWERSTAGVMTTSPGASFFISSRRRGRSVVVPVIFSRNTFPHPAAFNWRTWPVSSWAAVETRA
jgi:hypothetical protein